MLTLLAIAVAGFMAQLIDGSLGMGYGVSSTTLLLALGLAPALASASVHLAEIGTSGVSGASHWRLGNVDGRILLTLGIPGGVGAFVGAVVLANLSLDAARPWVSVVLLILGAVIIGRFIHGRRAAASVARSAVVRPAELPPDTAEAADVDASPVKPRRSRRWMLIPLGVFGGFLDASGGGGWGPVTTSTLMASGRLKPRMVIGTVSGAEFIVSVAASVGFLLALGSEQIRWDVAFMLLIGGSIAAPISAWLVRQFSDRALGIAVGALIILLNIDRLLLLAGVEAGIVTTVRLVVVVAALLVIAALIFRGRELRRQSEAGDTSTEGVRAEP